MSIPSEAARTDEQLLESFIAGDEAAFAEIHRRHSNEIVAYLRMRYFDGDESRAEDATQQAFIKLSKEASCLDLSEPVRPWLFSIAAHCAIDAQRWLRRRPSVSLSSLHDPSGNHDMDFDPTDPRDETGATQILTGELVHQVKSAVGTLQPQDREAIEAVYYQGLSFSEAAKSLAIPAGSLKTRVHRALRALRCRLDSPESLYKAA